MFVLLPRSDQKENKGELNMKDKCKDCCYRKSGCSFIDQIRSGCVDKKED